jgi:hypothetical protein
MHIIGSYGYGYWEFPRSEVERLDNIMLIIIYMIIQK